MLVTQRQAALGILALLLIGLLPPTIVGIAIGAPALLMLLNCVLIVFGLALARAIWLDWPAAYPLLVLLSIANSVIVPPIARLNSEIMLVLLIPLVVALIVGRPIWVVLAAVATPLLFLARGWGEPQSGSATLLGLYTTIAIGILIARLVVDTALWRVSQHTRELEQAKAHVEAHAEALTLATEQQAEQLDQQRKLLDLVATLEAPAITLATGVLLMPVVGHLDQRRAQLLTSRLLQAAHQQRARLVIIDVAAISLVDTGVAQALLSAAQALRLLGCKVALSGISGEIATTLTQLDIALNGISTVRSPQEALARVTY
jgi:anti-anti-sigma regulatory factor